MPSYDASQYDPPAPIAVATIRDLDRPGSTAEVVLLVDTGADVTLLPREVVEGMGIKSPPNVRYELAAFDGSKTLASVADLDMIFLSRVYRGRYLLINSSQGVLGRDVLNHLALLFNGPEKTWSEQRLR